MHPARLVLFTLLAFLVLFVARRILLFVRGGLSVNQLNEMKARGALVVDVRTPGEFRVASAPGSLNIPLDQLGTRLGELPRERPILLCCATGARSGYAKQFLQQQGFTDVHNAGPWQACR